MSARTRSPDCPQGCIGHYDYEHNLTGAALMHVGETRWVGPSHASVRAVVEDGAALRVMVIRHDLQPPNSAVVWMDADDAAKWATVLDAVDGCAELAAALRKAVADAAAMAACKSKQLANADRGVA